MNSDKGTNFTVLPGMHVAPFQCNLVNGLTTAARVWSSDEINTSFSLIFFFPMTSGVDPSEILALNVHIFNLINYFWYYWYFLLSFRFLFCFCQFQNFLGTHKRFSQERLFGLCVYKRRSTPNYELGQRWSWRWRVWRTGVFKQDFFKTVF